MACWLIVTEALSGQETVDRRYRTDKARRLRARSKMRDASLDLVYRESRYTRCQSQRERAKRSRDARRGKRSGGWAENSKSQELDGDGRGDASRLAEMEQSVGGLPRRCGLCSAPALSLHCRGSWRGLKGYSLPCHLDLRIRLQRGPPLSSIRDREQGWRWC